MSEHRQEFDNELDAIESKVIELFAMVAEGLPVATQALLNGSDDAYPLLAERDTVIDALYVEVEGLANREILLQAPVASGYARLLGSGDEFVAEVPLGDDGGFRFFAAPGEWVLRVLAPGNLRLEQEVTADIGQVTKVEFLV